MVYENFMDEKSVKEVCYINPARVCSLLLLLVLLVCQLRRDLWQRQTTPLRAAAATAAAGVDDFVDVLVEFDGRARERESARSQRTPL